MDFSYLLALSINPNISQEAIYLHCESKKQDAKLLSISSPNINPFLADRTIGRAFVTACRLSVCLSVCLSSVVCDVLYSGETAGPICMKFLGKMWSDHGTT